MTNWVYLRLVHMLTRKLVYVITQFSNSESKQRDVTTYSTFVKRKRGTAINVMQFYTSVVLVSLTFVEVSNYLAYFHPTWNIDLVYEGQMENCETNVHL